MGGPSPPDMQPPSLQEAVLTDSSHVHKTCALQSCLKSPFTPQTPIPSHGRLPVTPDLSPNLHFCLSREEVLHRLSPNPQLRLPQFHSMAFSPRGLSDVLGTLLFPASQQLTSATTSELMEHCSSLLPSSAQH